jgi:DNA-binding CsgD family transcriptional regulator
MQPIQSTESVPADRRVIALSDPRYFQAIGQVARAIGAEDFHEQLLDLLRTLIAHDSAWIVRYSRNAPPDVIYTQGVAQHLVGYYLEHAYYRTDPFFCDWRSTDRSGVILLRDAFAAADDKEFYRVIFQRKARFSDEMAVFLPALGNSCIALFIEKKSGHFSEHETAIANIVFPAIEGLHRAHLANLFAALRSGGTPESRKMLKLPTLIVDRAGASIHANAEWRRWERCDRRVKAARQKLDAGGSTNVELGETAIMRVERFDRKFHLAPSGKMFVIAERPSPSEAEAARARARADLERLARRERQIATLTVIGWTLGEIAQRLEISKGTIKNYRLSLYRKIGISSERTLISRFWPLIEDFRKDPLVMGGLPSATRKAAS